MLASGVVGGAGELEGVIYRPARMRRGLDTASRRSSLRQFQWKIMSIPWKTWSSDSSLYSGSVRGMTHTETPVRILKITGLGRSGSTIIDIVLGTHPNIESVGE